jgi:hypothetical protein
MALDEERDKGVEFVEGVEDAKEVAGVTVCCESEQVA